VLLGASVLAHELGHCVAARLLGMQVIGVRLYLLGGVSELARLPRGPREEAVIAATGPAVSAVLAGGFWLIVNAVSSGTVGWLLLMLLTLSNLVIAVFNLLPALPLDGGRVLRAGVWQASGNRRAGTATAVVGGYVIALLLVGWAIVLLVDGDFLPAGIAVAMSLFVAVGAAAERQQNRRADWPAGLTIASLARPVVQLPTETPVALALDAAADRAVILTEADGVARGLLDEPAARAMAERDPRAPASLVARPLTPDAIVLVDDDPAEVAQRSRTAGMVDLLLVDESGQPAGVLRGADLLAAQNRSAPARSGWLQHRSAQHKTSREGNA